VRDVFAFAVHGGYVSRPPSFLERYGTTGGYLPTPDLRSESAWALDWGARAKKKFGKITLAGEATGFATFAKDLIIFVPRGYLNLPKAENIGEAWLSGLETRAVGTWGPFDVRVSYTLTATGNRSACTTLGCPPLPGRPLHDFVIDALATLGPLRFRYGMDVIGGMRYDNIGQIEIPARALQSAGVRFRPIKGIEWALDIRNITDERTATLTNALGFQERFPLGDAIFWPLPGRTVLLSLRISTGEDAP